MEFIPNNRILQFNKDQLNSVRNEYNLDKPGDMSRAIDVLEAWIKMQNHFTKKEFSRNYLEKAILASKGSLERAKNKLDKICTFRTVMPEFFAENLTKNICEDLCYIWFCYQNYRIFMLKFKGLTFSSSLFLNCYRYAVLMAEYSMVHDYSKGLIAIVDYQEADVLEIVKALNITELRQIITIIIEGYQVRLTGIFVLSASKSIDMLVSIVKQLISPKLAKRISVHKDISSMYQYVSKDLLPVEYGGKEKPLAELHAELIDELTRTDFKNYIEEMSNANTDYSGRQGDTFNEQYLGMPGSFRTLNVD